MATQAIRMTSCCSSVNAFQSAAKLIWSTKLPDDRHRNLFDALFSVLPCDAAVLLTLSGDTLIPAAAEGFRSDLLGRCFNLTEHPRLRAFLNAKGPIAFEQDAAPLSSFDGMLEGDLLIRMEMGAPLRAGEKTIGVLVIDIGQTRMVDRFDVHQFSLFATLAAANLQTAELVRSLTSSARKKGMLSKHLMEQAHRRGGGDLLGQSPVMKRLKREIQIVADADLIVLITGETGTGKELVARSIHAQSARSEEPLIYVNCAALPESIAESELFGHMRGAYTGADANRIGRFELADKGTLFLDEIGELPISGQPKLLRAIQSGEIQRLGSDKNARTSASSRPRTEISKTRSRLKDFESISITESTCIPSKSHPFGNDGRTSVFSPDTFWSRRAFDWEQVPCD